jgi:drug/metabolite transporter (DMT)-like permease
MNAPATTGKAQDWLADFVMLGALWGASFLFMRMGAAEFGPLATAWLRVCIATLMLFPLMAWQGHLSVFKANWKTVLGFGVINSALPFVLYAFAVMAHFHWLVCHPECNCAFVCCFGCLVVVR